MLDPSQRPSARPVARATRRATASDRCRSPMGSNGHDPFHWLRAENWQAVLEGPVRSARRHPGGSGRRKPLRRCGAGARSPTSGRRSRRRCEAASRKTTRTFRCRTAPFEYYCRHRDDGQHQILCRRRRGRGRRIDPARWRRACGRQGLFRLRQRPPFGRTTGCSPGASTTAGRSSTRCASAISRPVRICADLDPADGWRRRLVLRWRRCVLRPGRRPPSGVPGVLSRDRHRRGQPIALVLEETRPGLVRVDRRVAVQPLRR